MYIERKFCIQNKLESIQPAITVDEEWRKQTHITVSFFITIKNNGKVGTCKDSVLTSPTLQFLFACVIVLS